MVPTAHSCATAKPSSVHLGPGKLNGVDSMLIVVMMFVVLVAIATGLD